MIKIQWKSALMYNICIPILNKKIVQSSFIDKRKRKIKFNNYLEKQFSIEIKSPLKIRKI